MGMFDYVRCNYPLPNSEVQDLEFQTKDLNNEMTLVEITKEGRLLVEDFEYEEVPEEERPYYGKPEWDDPKSCGLFKMLGCLRKINRKWRDTNYHGDFRFYNYTGDINTDDYEWYEFVARFDNGNLIEIRRKEAENGG